MTGSAKAAFETFLVEDVILTLGSLRGALGWLGSAEDCPAAARAEGFARIARQIAALEDRARALWQVLQDAPEPPPAAEDGPADNLFDLGPAPSPFAAQAVFRSRRPGA